MPLTTGRRFGVLAAGLDLSDEALPAPQAALVLGGLNWLLQGVINSNQPDLRHFVAGVVAEAGLHDPPVRVWVHFLHKQLQTNGRKPVRHDTLARHISVLAERGDLTVTEEIRNGRACHYVTGTPAFLERARRRASVKLKMLRAVVLACDRLGDGAPSPLVPGGPLHGMAGGTAPAAPALAA